MTTKNYRSSSSQDWRNLAMKIAITSSSARVNGAGGGGGTTPAFFSARRLAAADRVIALVLRHGVDTYRLHDRLLISYNHKIGLSLPFPCQASIIAAQ
jgi:hypothetical protein